MSDPAKQWRTLSSRPIYDDDFIGLRLDRALTPGGAETNYSVVSFKRHAVGVVPLHDDGTVELVGQWRYPLGVFSWELPEGGAENAADPLEEARRELREETGLEAAQWRTILRLHLSNSSTNEAGTIFLATGLSRVGEPELEHSEQDMQQARAPFAEVLARIARGEITDGLTVAGILRTHQMAVQGELGQDLGKAILG
jgi:8-oxo-dGTP pyrophosphatase MutT (NUDIX family)